MLAVLLAIDVGNANVKLGLFSGEDLVYYWRLTTDPRRTADEYGVLLAGLLARGSAHRPIDGAIIGSVVPRMNRIVGEVCERYLDTQPIFLRPDPRLGMPLLTLQPEQTGVDRLADALAGVRYHGTPLITVDLGTATVFNAISAAGELLGGAISPGLGTVADSIVSQAAKLPPVPLEAPAEVIGRDTATAMQSGLILGYVGLVEGIINRFREQLGRCTVVATGGFCRVVGAQTRSIEVVDPYLTLRGLRLAHELLVGGR